MDQTKSDNYGPWPDLTDDWVEKAVWFGMKLDCSYKLSFKLWASVVYCMQDTSDG